MEPAEQSKKPYQVKRLDGREVSRLALALLERRIAVLRYEEGMDDNPHQARMLALFLKENYIVEPEGACLLYYTEPVDQNGFSTGGVEVFATEDVKTALGLVDTVRTKLSEGRFPH